MRFFTFGLFSALALGTLVTPADAAEDVRPDAVLHIARLAPTHRLVFVEAVQVPYGPGLLGFEASGPDRQARGPETFDVDSRGGWVVADPVRGEIVRVLAASGKAVVTPIAALHTPFTDMGIDRDGTLHVFDVKTRTILTLGTSAPISVSLSSLGPDARFSRHGEELLLHSGTQTATAIGVRTHTELETSMLRRGTLARWVTAASVTKCNAEAGLVTLGHNGKQVQVETGGVLASIRLLGMNAEKDTFVELELFRVRGRLDVDRRVVVLSSLGDFKASLALEGGAAVPVVRDLVLGPRGDLHRMVPGGVDKGVTFSRWELRR